MTDPAIPIPSRRSTLAVNLIVAGISLALFLTIAEIAVRLVGPDLYYKNQFFPKNRDIDFPQFYQKDSELLWRFRPDQTIDSRQFSTLTYRINALGIRGDEVSEQKTGKRIIALGNSCTFGWGVGGQHTWAVRLQQQLNTDLAPETFEVLNCGVPGYSSFQGRKYLARLLPLEPDIVLIIFGWNDHFPAGHGIRDNQQQMPPGVVLWIQNLVSRLQLYQVLRKVVLSVSEEPQNIRLGDISLMPRVTVLEMGENLTAMIDTIRHAGAEPVLVVPPIASQAKYSLPRRSPFHEQHAAYQAEIRKVALLTGTLLINLQPVFDEHDDLFDSAMDDPIHFNSRGHWIAASMIADSLKTWLSSK